MLWLGTLGYLLYQAVMFCFATPLNNLFLMYVAHLGLAVWSIVVLLRATDLAGFGARLAAELPVRFVAGFAITVAALNAVAWLAEDRAKTETFGLIASSRLIARSKPSGVLSTG